MKKILKSLDGRLSKIVTVFFDEMKEYNEFSKKIEPYQQMIEQAYLKLSKVIKLPLNDDFNPGDIVILKNKEFTVV